MKALAILLALCAVALADDDGAPKTRWSISVASTGDEGTHIEISFKRSGELPADLGVLVLRTTEEHGKRFAKKTFDPIDKGGAVLVPRFLYPGVKEYRKPISLAKTPVVAGDALGEWTLVAYVPGDPETPIGDDVASGSGYVYAFVPVSRGAEPDTYQQIVGHAVASEIIAPEAGWFYRKRWFHLVMIGIIAGSLFGFTRLAKRKNLFIRRLPGVDAIEDAVGRSTEMGRPILYVTGVEQAQHIETLASLLILGHVAKIAAEYDTDLEVANAFPLTMVIAEEIVRQGYANAGRADAHRPETVQFITSEQFAFAAAVNGIILRDKPATNIFFGKFYAESLMLAETGFLTGAVQIAGTAELTQLPFFVSACDYTLMGEELFACSAYLTREPNQIALVKAGDVMKVVIAVLVVFFATCATLASQNIAPFTRFSIGDLLP